MDPLCYINEEFKPHSHISLPISDLSIQRGYGVFDFIAQHGDSIPYLNSYLERFYNSARLMNIQVPIGTDELREKIFYLAAQNKLERGGIKLILTGGNSVDGYTPGKPNFIILHTPMAIPESVLYSSGVSLITFNYRRSIPEAKTIDYAAALSQFEKMKSSGASDILYVWENTILEASRCNFFMLKNNVLITPKENILFGITRAEVIKLAEEEHDIEEREIRVEELTTADSCFISSTTKGIMPVTVIDNMKINRGQIHPVVKFLMGEFNKSYNK